jgi:hypothetical protein
VKLKQIAALISTLHGPKHMETHMSAAIARFLPRASASLVADINVLVSTAIFCGIGLLLSLSVLILDQHIPGDWF